MTDEFQVSEIIFMVKLFLSIKLVVISTKKLSVNYPTIMYTVKPLIFGESLKLQSCAVDINQVLRPCKGNFIYNYNIVSDIFNSNNNI